VTAAIYVYMGAEERVYPAFSATAPDGTTQTLVAAPGMSPVELAEMPTDGLWVRAADKPPSDEKPAKGAKAVTS
jgi:hypothetical protein